MINHLKLRDTLNAYDYTIGEFMVMVGKAQSYLGSVYMFKSDEADLCQKIIDSDSLAEADIKVLDLKEIEELARLHTKACEPTVVRINGNFVEWSNGNITKARDIISTSPTYIEKD